MERKSRADISDVREIGVYIFGLLFIGMAWNFARFSYRYIMFYNLDALSNALWAAFFLAIAAVVLRKYKWWDGYLPFSSS